MAITFYKFGAQWGIADPSPFCVKLESFFRLNDIPFEAKNFEMEYMKKAPKQKFPFVEFENGELMGDSTLIIERLSHEKKIDMNGALTNAQKAQSHIFCRMLDEATYFGLLYSRWVDDKGWAVISNLFFDKVPSFLRGIISSKARKDVTKSAWMQGTARHSQEDVYAMICKDLDALSACLGDDEWFFGAPEPTLLDIWCHANVINVIEPPIENSVKTHAKTLQNLVDHAHRFQALVYGKDTA